MSFGLVATEPFKEWYSSCKFLWASAQCDLDPSDQCYLLGTDGGDESKIIMTVVYSSLLTIFLPGNAYFSIYKNVLKSIQLNFAPCRLVSAVFCTQEYKNSSRCIVSVLFGRQSLLPQSISRVRLAVNYSKL